MVVTPSQASPEAANPVDMISALLDAEKITPDAPVDGAQPVEDAHEPKNNAQIEGEDAPDPEGETEEVAEIPLEQLEALSLEVKYKGEDGKDVVEKKPIKELRDGYMRQQDYSRKTADLARQRDGHDEKVRQAIDSERSALQQSITSLQALVVEMAAPELKDVNWNDLATNNPFEYVRLDNRRKQIGNTLQQLETKRNELTAKQKAEADQRNTKTGRETWQKLEAEIPGFDTTMYQTLLKSAIDTGVAPEVASNWLDAGSIKLAHKAYLYDQLKVGKPAESKKVVTPPTAIKPGASNVVPKQAQRQGRALDNLRKSGSIDDLASVIANMK